ncbi:MAG: nucleotidyl transferase AbiEii/AbiGii toxin family protein [bacterium]|nr:nucleotidyl transferase AbiEii/AbiGii toxin family protein [bacterium]
MAKTILNPVQKQILAQLAKNKIFGSNFYLSGGTALSEFYLHHRFSEDLDFFSENEIDITWLNSLAKKISKEIKSVKTDIKQSFNRNLVFFEVDNVIKTEFTYYPFPQIEKARIINGIKIDSLTDIAVNKFFTVYQKPSARHFIDLYLILKDKEYKFENLQKMARMKFDFAIDQIQLGSQLIKSREVKDLPHMIIDIPENDWRNYFVELAKGLKSRII